MKLSELSPEKMAEMKEELRISELKTHKEAPVVIQEDNFSKKENQKVCGFCGALLPEGQHSCLHNHC